KDDALSLSADVQVVGKFKQYGGGIMKERLREASVAHFNGPLTMHPHATNGIPVGNLAKGNSPTELFVLIGTIDLANGCWLVIDNRAQQPRTQPNYKVTITNREDFPANIHPVAEVEFSPGKAGEKPIVQRCELTERC